MDHALIIWGYEISATVACGLIAAYLIICVGLIIVIPICSVPSADENIDATAKVLDLRQRVRQSVMQVVGGVTIVAAFVTTLQNIRKSEDEFKEKKSTHFVNGLADLLSDPGTRNARVKAMQMLSFVAKTDPSYHRAVYDAIAEHAITLSENACWKPDALLASQKRQPEVEMAVRHLAERNPAHDPTKRRFNIEGVCLVGADLRDQRGVPGGLREARMSNAILLRADFTGADLSGTELQGVQASDYSNDGWKAESGYQLHRGEQGDER